LLTGSIDQPLAERFAISRLSNLGSQGSSGGVSKLGKAGIGVAKSRKTSGGIELPISKTIKQSVDRRQRRVKIELNNPLVPRQKLKDYPLSGNDLQQLIAKYAQFSSCL
jgi:hypothetical protein